MLATDIEATVVHSVITAHQATGHRFEVDAEAALPTIRCWDFGTLEIIAQSPQEIGMAASMARDGAPGAVTVHVPAPLVPTAHAALEEAAARIQPFWAEAGHLRFGEAKPA